MRRGISFAHTLKNLRAARKTDTWHIAFGLWREVRSVDRNAVAAGDSFVRRAARAAPRAERRRMRAAEGEPIAGAAAVCAQPKASP